MTTSAIGGSPCRGCLERQHQIDDLRQIVTTLKSGMNHTDEHPENDRLHQGALRASHEGTDQRLKSTTYISETSQANIDRIMLDSRLQADEYRDALNKMSVDYEALVESNKQLSRSLAEKNDVAEFLRQQNVVYAGDFVLERKDRERAHGKLVEMEKELELSRQRVAELERRNTELMVNALSIDDQVFDQHRTVRTPHHTSGLQHPTQLQQQNTPCHHNNIRASRHYQGRPPRGGYDECDLGVVADAARRRLVDLTSHKDGQYRTP